MELYDAKNMPLSSDSELRMEQERYARGERFFTEHGRDQYRIKKELGKYQCKSNYCYRAISQETYELYKKQGFVSDNRPKTNEYMESVDENGKVFSNNSGIDWYLGGAAPGRYGMIVIECPADIDYFQPAIDNGCHMTIDPTVRHMKSSPKKNPIPFSMITNVFDYKKIILEEKAQFDELRKEEIQKRQELRNQQMSNIVDTNFDQLSNGGMAR